METPKESDSGYPEEQPDEVAPDGGRTPQEESAREGRKEERKGEAKEELARTEEKADAKAEEVANLERRT